MTKQYKIIFRNLLFNSMIGGANLQINDKSAAITALDTDPLNFLKLTPNLKNDIELVRLAILNQPTDIIKKNIKFVTGESLNNKEIMSEVLLHDINQYERISNELKFDRDILSIVISSKQINIEFMYKYFNNTPVMNNKILMRQFIKLHPNKFDSPIFGIDIKTDVTTARLAILKQYNDNIRDPVNLNILATAQENIKNNKQFMIEAVSADSNAYQYASDKLKNDPELARIVFYSENPNFSMIDFIGSELLHNDDFINNLPNQELKTKLLNIRVRH